MNAARSQRDDVENRRRFCRCSRWRWLVWGLVCLALLAAFAGYTDPDFMLLLANQLWGCF
ncbi:hypothetical protein [Extensimonas sp. H3M7-6]|jgi:hypothetical protein|uniref:hypothetical protein n=1 Tax=Extensimonas soli TaxID=3031322 RepID=UPI0023DB632B|nr:hypothetical protein [Extensimonas sp. H3M7-6]MDF1481296.1 hypothetical protein [Extensimonas sp. H3M7-6]